MGRPVTRRVVKAARSLLDGLGDHPVLVVDTAPVIYWLEGHPRLAARFGVIFDAAEAGAATVVVSTVTLAEVLAGPLRAGNELLTAQYREALTRSPGWQVMPLDVDVAVGSVVKLVPPFGGKLEAQVNGVWTDDIDGNRRIGVKLLNANGWFAE